MKVLVTGGAGYIGSTTAKALEEAGHTPVILDSLLTGPLAFVRDRIFYEGDIADRALLRRVVDEHPDIEATIHMAARIVVPESVEKPYEYYRDNVAKSLELFDELNALGKGRVLFSSSASIYALKDEFEVSEGDRLEPTSPYARTKRMMEEILQDMAAATDLRAIILRYFNPIGSDPDLESGIYAKEPSHVLGQLVMAARGQKDAFTITGTEHPTRDGTGIRDYIHVWDLARAHVRAVERFDDVIAAADAPSVVINVGTGSGVTVRELVASFERVFGQEVPRARGAAAARRRGRGVRQRRPVAPAAGLADRAVAGRRDRLRARVGRQAPGDPGVRVRSLLGVLLAGCAGRRRGAGVRGVAGGSRAGRRPAAGGQGRGDRPGAPAGQPQLPAQDQPAGAGGRVQEGLQHHRHRHQRRLPGGDDGVAGLQAAAAPAVRLGATVKMTRHSNRQDRWGPCVDRRGRAGNKIHADAKISVHGDGSYASGARGFHVIAPTDRKPWTHDIYRPSKRLALATRAALKGHHLQVANYIAGGDGLDFRSDLGTLNLSNVPTVMVELGNMRNASDAYRMTHRKGRQRYAAALAGGVRHFLR